jgi:threonine/homoserine/homoserine lactone efflux protein
MEPILLLKSVGLGLAVAAPIGPVGVLCISRTLAAGKTQGVLTGVGVAVADMVAALVVVLGLSAVGSFLDAEKFWLRLVGGLFLLLIGARMAWNPAVRRASSVSAQDLAHLSLSGFLMAVTNPATLLGFTGLMAALGIQAHDALDGVVVVGGVFAGSMLWWVILAFAAGMLRGWLSDGHLLQINRVLGCVLMVAGLAVLVAVAFGWFPEGPSP